MSHRRSLCMSTMFINRKRNSRCLVKYFRRRFQYHGTDCRWNSYFIHAGPFTYMLGLNQWPSNCSIKNTHGRYYSFVLKWNRADYISLTIEFHLLQHTFCFRFVAQIGMVVEYSVCLGFHQFGCYKTSIYERLLAIPCSVIIYVFFYFSFFFFIYFTNAAIYERKGMYPANS